MNLGLHIFNELQEKGSAPVPGFGKFTLEKKSAQYDEAQSALLPPAYELTFESASELRDNRLAAVVSEKTGQPLSVVESQIRETVAGWHAELQQHNKLSVPELGTFTLENGKVELSVPKALLQVPHFYGLEAINLQEIATPEADEDQRYVFNKSLLWTFLFILPLGGMVYLAFSHQELLFGKKSLQLSVTASTHRIPEKKTVAPVKRDTLKPTAKDTLSIKPTRHEKK